ncbi:MAG: sulfatase-like hydrolase/transferase, partial [Chloroflexi bacterium]|nr:sulfatase-like hydrolase/transferase [Chloroflexota bacterium]
MVDARPNIILIVADQWRGDCLSIAGHPVVHTPHLDEMALSGVRFNRAYTACPSCIPARAGLYTGMAQEHHGRVGYRDGVAWDYPVTMAGELTAAGYQTQAIGKMHVYPERSQMGFQNVILHDGYLHYSRKQFAQAYDMVDDYLPWLRRELGRDADYFDHGVNCNSMVARPWDKEEYLHPTNWVVSQGIDFLRRRDPRKPFFLYLSFHRPHPPLDPPAWAFE